MFEYCFVTVPRKAFRPDKRVYVSDEERAAQRLNKDYSGNKNEGDGDKENGAQGEMIKMFV